MRTRKIQETPARNENSHPLAGKIKTIQKPFAKSSIREMITHRLRNRGNGQKRPRKQPREEQLAQLIDHSRYECPICLEIAIHPIILRCGHAYCLKCFEENSIFTLRCCLCRLEINAEEIHSARMIENIINRFIVPTTSQEISYWCRKGEFADWEAKRRIDLPALRVGDSIDLRTEDNNWRRALISNFKFELNQYCLQAKVCINAKLEHILVPASSRRLAPCGFFTKGLYLKYRTTNYQSKFVESIQIPEIHCEFIDEQMEDLDREEKCSQDAPYQHKNSDLALELFEFEMKEWENVFQLG